MMAGNPDVPAALFALPCDLPPIPASRAAILSDFAKALYGPVPATPRAMRVARFALPEPGAVRLQLTLDLPGGAFVVDAALFLPETCPAPVICGLDFIGPAGVLASDGFPLDPSARILVRPESGFPDGRLRPALRGSSGSSWPVDLIRARGYGLLLSCYGSWVPDDPGHWRRAGIAPLVGVETRAISLWAWAIMRLVDVAHGLSEVDPGRILAAGHSRLGKAALWAAANDERIAAVFANQSGCGGAAPAAHRVGETLDQMHRQFPHWILPPRPMALDQNALIAAIAPRQVILGAAAGDTWADPIGSYLALRSASAARAGGDWPEPRAALAACGHRAGPLGWFIRQGGHGLLHHDWRQALDMLQL